MCGNVYFSDNNNNRIRKVTFNPTCSPTLETKQINPTPEFSIYPNPTTTEITITGADKIKEVLVYDVVGKIRARRTGSGERVVHIDVSVFAPGVYFVQVLGDDGRVVVRRFVKE